MLTLFKPKIGRNVVDLCSFFPFRFKLVPGSYYITHWQQRLSRKVLSCANQFIFSSNLAVQSAKRCSWVKFLDCKLQKIKLQRYRKAKYLIAVYLKENFPSLSLNFALNTDV